MVVGASAIADNLQDRWITGRDERQETDELGVPLDTGTDADGIFILVTGVLCFMDSTPIFAFFENPALCVGFGTAFS
ncbi:hypothetical protein, partial [uncultured Acidaminococcus sp.]|uniref:hypothetical protein n=1 Tax=uncultured Acidaminococcus sp. TaxID=352152 RepID=UPI00265E9C15